MAFVKDSSVLSFMTSPYILATSEPTCFASFFTNSTRLETCFHLQCYLPCLGESPMLFDNWIRIFNNYFLVNAWPEVRKRATLLHCPRPRDIRFSTHCLISEPLGYLSDDNLTSKRNGQYFMASSVASEYLDNE